MNLKFINLKFSKKTWIIIFILICIILFFSFINTKKLFEGFDSNSRYKYLAPIPPTTVWSQETQDAYNTKIKGLGGNYAAFPDVMKNATEEEAKQWIDTGLWPWDDEVTEWWQQEIAKQPAPTTTSDTPPPSPSEIISSLQKAYPNRNAYMMTIFPSPPDNISRVPMFSIYSKLSNPGDQQGYSIGDNQNIICDGEKMKIKNLSDKTYTDSSDYTLFEKIPGLKFVSEACNLCTTPQCKVTVDGTPSPEAYNVYVGASSPTESTPSSLTDSMPSSLSSSSSSSDTSSSTTSSISDSNYQSLLSLCKSVIGK